MLLTITRARSSPLFATRFKSLLRSFVIQARPALGARQYTQLGEFLYLLPVQFSSPGFILWTSGELALLFEVPLSILRFPVFDGRSAFDDVEGRPFTVQRELRQLPFMLCGGISFLTPGISPLVV